MFQAIVLSAALVVGADPSDAAPRPFHEIQAEIRQALRQEAAAKDFPARSAAVVQLTELHRAIVGDPRFTASPTLKEYRNQVGVRLLSVQHELQRQLHRTRQRDAQARTDRQPAGESRLIDDQTAALASQLALAGYAQGGPLQFATGGSSGSNSTSDPAGDSRNGRFGGAIGPPDNGQALVDLIQRTIRPEHWDVHGGPGSIFYFAPLRCLVVSASAEVHHAIGGAVGGLRAAGGP